MNLVHALSERPKTLIIGIAVTAALLFAAMPGNARAECVSSTPSELALNADTALDNTDGAADIRELKASLDANCELTIRPVLLPLPLLANQLLEVQFSFEPRPADPSLELVDRSVFMFGTEAYLDDGTPLPTFEPSGFTLKLDELGVTTSPMELGIAVVSYFDPDPAVDFDEIDGDYYPELTEFMQRLPVSFTTPPPPPPPPAPPAPPALPAPPLLATPKQATCVVPKLKGLSVKKAKAALKKAGCKYKLKGKGRVRSFSPKAGTTTSATVNVKCKQKPKKKRKRGRRSSVGVA